MREKICILIDTGSESNRIMMSDVGKMENGIQITGTHRSNHRFVDFLIRAHFNYKTTGILDLPGKAVWSRFCVLSDLTKDDTKEYYIIIVNNAIHRLSVKYLKKLNEKKNIHLYSLLLDSFEFLPATVRKMILDTPFETVFSFQKSDCDKYGFEFTNQIYSKVDLTRYQSQNQKSDVYFAGADKNRMEEIYSIYKHLSQQGLRCDFTVIVDKKKQKQYQLQYPGIRFLTKRISYVEILQGISNTDCILELCQTGQDGLTMRFYEALFYNKKLITNNVTAKNHDYYDDRYMQVIAEAGEIDLDKLKQSPAVEYNYDNQLSPRYFAEKIMR